jgi:hypothetical protein
MKKSSENDSTFFTSDQKKKKKLTLALFFYLPSGSLLENDQTNQVTITPSTNDTNKIGV